MRNLAESSGEDNLPTSAEECVRLGDAAGNEGDDERALLLFKQATVLEPANLGYQFKYLYALVRDHQYAEADKTCQEAAQYQPAPSYLHLMWLRIPSHQLDWGLLIQRADQLLEKYPADSIWSVSLNFVVCKVLALRESVQFSKAREVIEVYWPLLLEACSTPDILYELQFLGMHEHALAYCRRLASTSGQTMAQGVYVQNTIAAMQASLHNREWVKAYAPDVKILSLSQNCLPYVLSVRAGLNRFACSEEMYTCFDLSGMHGDVSSKVLDTNFSIMRDRSQFSIQRLPGGIPMMRHSSGTVFAHERGQFMIGANRDRFHEDFERTINNFIRISKDGPRLFIFAVVGAGDPNLLVRSLQPRFDEGNVRLLVLDFKKAPTPCADHACVTHRHLPYPEDYNWNKIDHYTSDRGQEFEKAVIEAIRTEMARLQPPQIPVVDRIRQAAGELFYKRGIRAIDADSVAIEAGVTKPALFRYFASKDELAATYLKECDAEFWAHFERAGAGLANDPRQHLRNYLTSLGIRATDAGYRGCGLSNAAVEYTEWENQSRLVIESAKQALRARLEGMAIQMGAKDPVQLADGLLLLIEGAFISGQIFRDRGPAGSLAAVADLLIEASSKA